MNYEEVEKLTISTDNGSYSPTQEEVQMMYDYLTMYFHRSQMNGLVEIEKTRNNFKN